MSPCATTHKLAATALVLAWFCVCPILARGAILSAPAEYLIEVWQTDAGLPDNTVTGIAQTPDGYLWCATRNGLARFDGVRFKVFNLANTPELGSSRMQQLFVDRRGTLWISTLEGGLVQFKEGRFTVFYPSQRERPWKAFIGFADDESGKLWLTTEDSVVIGFADGKFTLESTNWHKLDPIPYQVRNDYQGRLWAQSTLELARLEGGRPVPVLECNAGQYEFHAPSRAGGWWVSTGGELRRWHDGRWVAQAGHPAWADRTLQHALEDRRGHLWVASFGNGVFRHDTNGTVLQLTAKQGLGGDFVRTLFEDTEGNLWVGAVGGGLSRVRPALFHVYGRGQGLSSDLVTSVCEGTEGELWVGTDGDGLNRVKDGMVRHYGPAEGVADRHVRCVLADRKGKIWAGTRGWGLLRLEDEHFISVTNFVLPNHEVFGLFEDARECLWLGQQTRNEVAGLRNNTVETLGLPNQLPTVDVRVIVEDAMGNLCIGTDGSGLFVRKAETWRHYTRQNGLGSDIIWSLHAEPDGTLWVGTFGGGLSRLKGDQLATCTIKQGLVDDVICHIADDGRGYFWFSSQRGVFRASKTELNEYADGARRRVQCVPYGKSDGLPTLQCAGGTQPAGCKSRDGRLWFSTIKGLVVVDPAVDESALHPKPPPVHIEEVFTDGEAQNLPLEAQANSRTSATNPYEESKERLAGASTAPTRVLRIGPGKRRYEFQYTAPSFAATENVRFKYRLEGLEEDWVTAGRSRLAAYAHVPPGHYVFRVTACNNDGVWNDPGATLALVVVPYFWQTWWFRIMTPAIVLGIIGGIIGSVERRKTEHRLEKLRQQNSVERERSRIARDMHDEVGAKLTKICFLSELAKRDLPHPAEAEREIDQVSATARELIRSLDEIVWAVNPKNDTLEDLVNYICRYAGHYFENTELQCQFEIPTQVPDRRLATDVRHNLFLAVKEALHNALKHSGGTAVRVRIGVQDARLEVSVSDNGRGFSPDAPPPPVSARRRVGNGLTNLRQRLEDLGGHCEITSASGRGTTVAFTLVLPPQSETD